MSAKDRLARYGAWCLNMTRQDGGSDLDGGILQDVAVECGLLEHVTVTEPCTEDGCYCAEYYGEFPAKCLRTCKDVLPFLKEWQD